MLLRPLLFSVVRISPVGTSENRVQESGNMPRVL